MTNIFRKILGLGPSKLSNVRPQQKKVTIKSIDEATQKLTVQDIFPALASTKTTEFDLKNELAAVFHERENSYASIVTTYVFANNTDLNKNDETDIFHIKTADKDEDYYGMLEDNGLKNLDELTPNFELWNPSDKKLTYKVLSLRVSFLASESILSKKHMLKAHEILDSDELMVSIPRRGLIFICANNLEPENYKNFLNRHSYIILDTKNDLELLCEDIFVLKKGEIDGILELNQLSDLIRNE